MLVKQLKMKQKNDKEDFLAFLAFGTLGASLLGNLLAGKGKIRAVEQLKEKLDQMKIFNAFPSFN